MCYLDVVYPFDKLSITLKMETAVGYCYRHREKHLGQKQDILQGQISSTSYCDSHAPLEKKEAGDH
jgi:hypothetical protein